MQLIADLQTQLHALDAQYLRRRRHVSEGPCAPEVRVTQDGVWREMLAFCSNDYLGLASHPAVVDALAEGASRYGAGSGASHLISGHSIAHHRLEERLAALQAPHLVEARALYFCTGYMANMAVLATLADADTEIFSEALNHASLIDGIRLSRARCSVYAHRDLHALGALLSASTARKKLIVSDTVFSMDGDIAPVPELLALAERHGAWLMLDDAHGFGVIGEQGRGALAHFGLRSQHIVYVGTLGKAAGVAGAFVAAHETVIEWLVQRARLYIFTTAAPPAVAHALLTSLELITGIDGETRRKTLRANIAQLYAGLSLRQWRLLPSSTAVQPVVIGDNACTMRAAAALQERGLWVAGIRPPTVPAGTSRLRATLSAAHTAEQVQRLVAELNALEIELTEGV